MSEVNWSLIDKVSHRFDQLLGLADDEQMNRLLANFHLVHAIMGGRLDRLLTEFMTMEPAENCPGVDWLGVKERLRQYAVRTDPVDLNQAMRSAGIVCDDSAVLHELDRLDAGGSELPGGQPLRMKLVKFDGPASFNTVETVFRSKELVPASLEHLICFAVQFADEIPDQLVGLGTLSIAREAGDRGVTEPAGGIYVPAVVRDPGPKRVSRLIFQRYDRLLSPQWADGKVFLAVRYPRERALAAAASARRP